MSEKKYYYAAGVIKFDYKAAGYRDLLQIAEELKKDEGFKQIIIRFVSETNLGIQFLYINENYTEGVDKDEAFPYLKQLKEQFGHGLYAWDVELKSFNLEELKTSIILNKNIDSLLS